MKYLQKYPQAVPVVYNGIVVAPDLEKTNNPQPCVVCKDTTVFVDVKFDEAICSEECLKLYTEQWAKVFAEKEAHDNRSEDAGTVSDLVRKSEG